MAFLEKVQFIPNHKPWNKTTKGFYIGTPEAEGENRSPVQNLVAFYEDYNEINQNINFGKFIISGRKGTGKSAYVKYMTDKSSEKNELYSSLIKSSDLNLESCIQFIPEEFQNKYEKKYIRYIKCFNIIRFIKNILA